MECEGMVTGARYWVCPCILTQYAVFAEPRVSMPVCLCLLSICALFVKASSTLFTTKQLVFGLVSFWVNFTIAAAATFVM